MKRDPSTSLLWTKNLTSNEDKEQLLESLRLSRNVLQRLTEILEEKHTEILNKAINSNSFLVPSWSERQASSMGELRNIQFILKLIGNIT